MHESDSTSDIGTVHAPNSGNSAFKNPYGTCAIVCVKRISGGSGLTDCETTNVLNGDFAVSFGDGAGKYIGSYMTIVATNVGWYAIRH